MGKQEGNGKPTTVDAATEVWTLYKLWFLVPFQSQLSGRPVSALRPGGVDGSDHPIIHIFSSQSCGGKSRNINVEMKLIYVFPELNVKQTILR